MKTLVSFLSILALVAVFMVPAHAQMAPAPGGVIQPGRHAGRGGHPEVHHAMRALQNAKNDLEHAAHDYQGHRTKAVQDIDSAMSELQQALAVPE